MQAKRAPHAAIEEAGVTTAFPIMATKHNTWEAVTAIDRIQPSIRPTSAAKIKASKVPLACRTSTRQVSWPCLRFLLCELCQIGLAEGLSVLHRSCKHSLRSNVV